MSIADNLAAGPGHKTSLCETCKIVIAAYDLGQAAKLAGRMWDGVDDLNRDKSVSRRRGGHEIHLLKSHESLEIRATGGCSLCRSFLRGLSAEARAEMQRHDLLALDTTRRRSFAIIYKQDINLNFFLRNFGDAVIPSSLSMTFVRDYRDQDFKKRILSTLLVVNNDDSANMSKIIESNTSSPSTLALARGWLNECLSDHPKCHASAKVFIPTYLVDIGQETLPTPRLCRGEDLPAGSKYMTLSHCWGEEQTVRLLEGSLEQMLKGIGFQSLSKTFQDAITVVQRLGQRYLWIDSLCITQDSPAHWLHESMLMGEIYANGICNISATASHDGSGGLFFDRNPEDIYSVLVQVKENEATRLCSICDPDIWNDNIINAPLNQRAWVCQERLLSPRNLHFAANQVFWECNTTCACENFPTIFPPEFSEAFQKQKLNYFISRTEAIPSDVELLYRPQKFWNDMVSIYTHGTLTFPTDKLVALGGLAAQMQRISNGEYLAGMWKERLVDQLCWFPLDAELEFSEPTEYFAPTWSWASSMQCVGGICRAPNPEGTMIDIVDAQVELASSNPFGQMKGGHLVIKGKLARAAYCETDSGKERTRQVNVQVDDRWELHSSKRFDPMDLLYVTWSTSRERALSGDGLLYLLPCYKAKFHMPGQDIIADPGYDDITGLVLVETRSRPGEFFRCGTFFLIAVGKKMIRDVSNVDNGCRFFDARCAESSLEYEEDSEHGRRYIVTII